MNKNAVELKLFRAVCSGDVGLASARKAIAKDWPALKKVGL